MVINSCVFVQITASGAHRCVCVQLRLYNLAGGYIGGTSKLYTTKKSRPT